MKRTLKREYKELEVVEREAIAASEGRISTLGGNLGDEISVDFPGPSKRLGEQFPLFKVGCTSWYQLPFTARESPPRAARRPPVTRGAEKATQLGRSGSDRGRGD